MKRAFLWGIVFISAVFTVEPRKVRASPNLDHQFELQTIGFLKSWDNVDGLFADYLSDIYKAYFSQQSRFVINDLSAATPILSRSKIPYKKVIQDPDILGELTRATKTESLIRTDIIKQGPKYLITIEWLHSPSMEVMSTVEFSIDEPENGKAFETDTLFKKIQPHLDQLIAQVPFFGNVTGRDDDVVTVNIGAKSHLQKGDTLEFGTLNQVKKHPLFKNIVDWDFTHTGKAVVEQVEDGISFCKIIEEEPGQQIARYQKVILVQTNSVQTNPNQTPPSNIILEDQKPLTDLSQESPTEGWVAISPWVGTASWQYSDPSSKVSNTGGGTPLLGGKAESELWFNPNWFSNLEIDYASWNFTQREGSSGTLSPASLTGGVGASVLAYKLNAGYSYNLTGDILGPRGWVKLGYKSSTFSLPTSSKENTGPATFDSVFLGVGGEFPFLKVWGVATDFSYRLFTSATVPWVSSSVNGTTDIQFYFGGYYHYSPRISFRAGFEIRSNAVTFSGGESLSQKSVTISPGLLYYF